MATGGTSAAFITCCAVAVFTTGTGAAMCGSGGLHPAAW